MKPRFFLVQSRSRRVAPCDTSKLYEGAEIKPITVSKRVLKSRVRRNEIDHFLQLFRIGLPAYKTKVNCRDGEGEIITYHSFLNRIFFVPIQMLIALNLLFLALASVGILVGFIELPEGDFTDLVGVMVSVAIAFLTFLFVMKFVAQFFARKSFQVIGDEVAAWLSA